MVNQKAKITKENGLKSALKTDFIETLARHPIAATLALSLNYDFGDSKPQTAVFADHLLKDGGIYHQKQEIGFGIDTAYAAMTISER